MSKPKTLMFRLHHRYSDADKVEDLYDGTFEVLSKLSAPWGLKQISKKPLPDYCGKIATGISYAKEVGSPIQSFTIGLMNRHRSDVPDDEPANDDTLKVEFYPGKVKASWEHLMKEVFPTYLAATSLSWHVGRGEYLRKR